MQLNDFYSETSISSKEYLNEALNNRSELNSNDFELWHSPNEFPKLNILVKNEYAYVHYFDSDDSPGYRPKSTINLDTDKSTSFCHGSPGNITEIWNGMVIPFSQAVEAAQQFFNAPELPKCIKWEEL